MTFEINMWTLHTWLDKHGISHYYSIEDDRPCFEGFRLADKGIDLTRYAVLTSRTDVSLFHVVLTYGRNSLYFRDLTMAEVTAQLSRFLAEYKSWIQGLYQANFRKEGLKQLLDKAAAFIPFPIAVFENTHLAACSAAAETFSDVLSDLSGQLTLREILESSLNQNVPADASVLADFRRLPGARLLYTWFASGKQIIWIMLLDTDKALSPGDADLLTRLRTYVMAYYRQRKILPMNDDLTVFIESKAASPYLLGRLQRQLRWKKGDSYCVYLIEQKESGINLIMNILCSRLASAMPSAVNMIYDDRILLIINSSLAGKAAECPLIRALITSGHFIIGRSTQVPGFENIPDLVRQAYQAAEHGRMHQLAFMDAKDMSADFILHRLHESADVQALIHPAVRRMAEIDRSRPRSFSLLRTLETLLLCGCNYNEASRQLNIHRNTLLSRIRQICEENALSPDMPDREALLLSLLLISN